MLANCYTLQRSCRMTSHTFMKKILVMDHIIYCTNSGGMALCVKVVKPKSGCLRQLGPGCFLATSNCHGQQHA